jgi:hypothetical protein
MAIDATRGTVLYDEQERTNVQQQLERLLVNPHFSHSKRFPSFLRFIVQEELEGRGDQLKERTLGIEVFGREADYDTTSDPIVRVTAAEIRKRIAQYYQDSRNPDELRISLPPGSYVPHFDWPARNPGSDAIAPSPLSSEPALLQQLHSISSPSETAVPIPEPTANPDANSAAGRAHHKAWLIAAGVLLAALAGGAWAWVHLRPSMLDSFWAPVLGSADTVIVCFPQSHFPGITLRDAADPSQQRHLEEPMNGVVLDDLQPLVSFSGLLETRHQRYILRGEDASTLTDLRQGPAIFLGAFDNAWTLRLTRNLRFRFGNDPQMTHFWIEDTQSPLRAHWSIDRNVQETTNNYRDYAIVARFRDANTGKIAVVAAGIARGGTVAAGEFLTQPGDMESIRAQAPKNWAGQNMEFVLSTEIIDGRSSPPKVEATYFW